MQTKSKYLGLPLVIGKSKAQIFKYVKEAAMRRVSSWKNKFLSNAGKEVLLKLVVMALPIYSSEIEKKMSNCWWGESDERRKIHWENWERLTKTKEAGGLEFKNRVSL